MMQVTDNRKARKRKTYANVVKVTKTQPLISENKSSHVNKKDGENQFDLEKIKFLSIKDEKLNPSRIATHLNLLVNRKILKLSTHKIANC